jgi:hypothetical protein
MTSFFFHSYECQGIQTQNRFDEILGLSLDLGTLKMNNVLDMSQFCKYYQKDSYNKTHLMGKK